MNRKLTAAAMGIFLLGGAWSSLQAACADRAPQGDKNVDLSAPQKDADASVAEIKQEMKSSGRFVPIGAAQSPISIPISDAYWNELMKRLMATKPEVLELNVPPQLKGRIADTEEKYTLVSHKPFVTGYSEQRCPSGLIVENILETSIEYLKGSKVSPEFSDEVRLTVECVDPNPPAGRGKHAGDSLSVFMSRSDRTITDASVHTRSVWVGSSIIVYEKNGRVQEHYGNLDQFLIVVGSTLYSFRDDLPQ